MGKTSRPDDTIHESYLIIYFMLVVNTSVPDPDLKTKEGGGGLLFRPLEKGVGGSGLQKDFLDPSGLILV